MPEITIGRLQGGFCVYWRDETGRRRRYRLEARTRAEAEAEGLIRYQRETFQPGRGVPTVADLWAEYRRHLGPKPTGKTMGFTGKAVLPHFGPYRPEQITEELCRAYQSKRIESGISVGSVHTELGHLQSTFNWAEKARRIPEAPHVWRPAKPETDKRILNRREALALIEACHAPHVRLASILLLGTAARVGAILDLTWNRVDLKGGVIEFRLPDSTTRKGRARVPMNRSVRAALQTARDAALSDYVIELGGKMVGSISKGIGNAIERARLGHVRIHDLRHTAAVTMLADGVPIEMVAQMLGHSNLATTYRVYGRYLPQHMQRAADVLDFSEIRASRQR